MQENKSVTLGVHYEKFIAQLIAKGRFGTTNEVIRAGLRLLEEREIKVVALRHALVEGEESGTAGSYSLKGLIETLDREGLA